MKAILAMFTTVLFLACTPKQNEQAKGDHASGLSEVKVGFPDKSKQFGNNADKITGFFLEIKPSSSGQCAGAISGAEPYSTTKVFSQKITQGCSYMIIAEVGTYDQTNKKLNRVFFSNRNKLGSGRELKASEFQGKQSISVTLQLDVTEDGRKEGFSGSTSTLSETDLVIDVQFGGSSPSQSPNNGGGSSSNRWPASKDFRITQESGAQQNFSDFVGQSQYTLIKVSGAFCSGCYPVAKLIHDEPLFNNSQCSHITIVGSGTVRDWRANLKLSQNIDDPSAVTTNLQQLQSLFPNMISVFPTLILVKSDGSVVTHRSGATSLPSFSDAVRQACDNVR